MRGFACSTLASKASAETRRSNPTAQIMVSRMPLCSWQDAPECKDIPDAASLVVTIRVMSGIGSVVRVQGFGF